MKKVLWIGPIVHPDDIGSYKAQSAAANVWQLGFISGLIENGYEVENVSYVPYSQWPRGPLWIRANNNREILIGLNQTSCAYLNITGIREVYLGLTILFILLRNFRSTEFSCFITYNPTLRHRIPIILYSLYNKIKWVSILADNFAKGRPHFTLFLSYDYFKRFKKLNKYFLDGGISNKAIRFQQPLKSPKILLYAGSQSSVTGLRDFVFFFKSMELDDFELHIYGYPSDKEIKELCNNSKNIKQFGFVEDEFLNTACEQAFAFINPRPKSIIANTTFPSKILYYMQYEKPIISTNVDKLAKRYNDLIFNYEHADIASFTSVLDKIESIDLVEYSRKIQYFKTEYSWNNQIKKFIDYAFDR